VVPVFVLWALIINWLGADALAERVIEERVNTARFSLEAAA